MSPIAYMRSRREAACKVLLIWLLALASGVANACLVQESASLVHDRATGAPVSDPAPALAGFNAGAADQGRDSGALNAHCLESCEAASQPQIRQQDRVEPCTQGLPLQIGVAWTSGLQVAVASAAYSADRRRAPPGPAIRVRYSRLAL